VCNVNNVDGLASILGCGVLSLPLKYLGFLLGAHFKAKLIWDGVIEKIDRYLAGWKMMYLSKGERITLIKSTHSSLPAYFFSFSFSCWCCQSHREVTMRLLMGVG